MAKDFTNVAQLIEEMNIPKSAKTDIQHHIQHRKIALKLTQMRIERKISQQEMARRCRWSQSRISKMESKPDKDIKLGDLLTYSQALKTSLELHINTEEKNLSEKMIMHIKCLETLLKQLKETCQGDQEMEQAANHFHEECLRNILRIMKRHHVNTETHERPELSVVITEEEAIA